jgi:hypothetical protein
MPDIPSGCAPRTAGKDTPHRPILAAVVLSYATCAATADQPPVIRQVEGSLDNMIFALESTIVSAELVVDRRCCGTDA